MKNKIVVIGAGSAVFSLNMIRDICATPGLHGSEICLVDINEERLNAVHRLCVRFAAETDTPLTITHTVNREEALVGADFVIVSVLACSRQKMIDGLTIAENMGYHYGGSLHIMHDEGFWINFYQYKVIEEIYLDTRRIAPDAWYILLSNPVMSTVTMLGRKYHDKKIVGLCEGPTLIHNLFAKLGFDESRVTYEVSGCNHFIWITKLLYDGEDAFPLVDKWIGEHQDDPVICEGTFGPKVIDLYKTFGAIPLGDTYSAGGGSNFWWYHSDREVERSFREDPASEWHGYYYGRVDDAAEIARMANDESVRITDIYKPGHSDEVIIELVEALACDNEKKIILNMLNDGNYVPGVPADYDVEIVALCNKTGIHGIHTDGLPRAVMGHLFADRIGMVEVELEAYRTRDEALLVDLVMMDHQTKSRAQAQKLVDEILNLEWNTEMREHYRGKGSKRYKM